MPAYQSKVAFHWNLWHNLWCMHAVEKEPWQSNAIARLCCMLPRIAMFAYNLHQMEPFILVTVML